MYSRDINQAEKLKLEAHKNPLTLMNQLHLINGNTDKLQMRKKKQITAKLMSTPNALQTVVTFSELCIYLG